MRFRQPFILTCRWEIDSIFLCDRRLRGKIASGAYALFGFFARSPPFGSYRAKKTDCGLPLPLNFLPRSRLLTFIAGICRPYVQSKSISKMKHQKFEIAVAGYDYRFKTYARDGVEASVKVKCFLGKPDAECTILVPALNDYLRETESCRRQVAQR